MTETVVFALDIGVYDVGQYLEAERRDSRL